VHIKAVFRKASESLAAPWVRHAVAIAALAFAVVTIASLWSDIARPQVLAEIGGAPGSLLSIVAVAALASWLRSERLYLLLRVTDSGARRGVAYLSFAYGLLLSFTPAKSAELLRFSHGPDADRVGLGVSARIFLLEKLADVGAVGLIASAVFVNPWVAIVLLAAGLLLARPAERRILGPGGTGLATAWSLGLSVGGWVIEGALLHILLEQFVQPQLAPLSVIAGFAVSSLAGALSFVPAGILVSEIAFLKLVNSGSGAVFAMVLVFRITILLTNLLIGIGAWYLLLSRQRSLAVSQRD